MSIFALVDCNNFYVSCERVFNPTLENHPVLVLSNNDGCIIARSNQAKALGIPMGAPFYKWEAFCKKNKVFVVSSNYALYADMSHRVMRLLEYYCPDIEIYSIDEAFLKLDSYKIYGIQKYLEYLRYIIKTYTGLPISIGVAPTKTLAKIANLIAKKHTKTGLFNLLDESQRENILTDFPIRDIWGVGSQLAKHLQNLGIETAKQLRDADLKTMRKNFSVVMEKMIEELRGISCMDLEIPQPRKQIISSRSFGKPVIEFDEIAEALSHYAAIACHKLRKQHSHTQCIAVFLQTNVFQSHQSQYANSASYRFPTLTANTSDIIHAAKICLKKIFRRGFRYHKTGIMLMDLVPNTVSQLDLFIPEQNAKKKMLHLTLDKINATLGKESLFFAAEGIQRKWQLKSTKRSPRYTTQWDELLKVICE